MDLVFHQMFPHSPCQKVLFSFITSKSLFPCREGTLKVGDRILAVNSVDVTRMSLIDVTSLLRRSKSHVHLLVEYDVSVMGQFSQSAVSAAFLCVLLRFMRFAAFLWVLLRFSAFCCVSLRQFENNRIHCRTQRT